MARRKTNTKTKKKIRLSLIFFLISLGALILILGIFSLINLQITNKSTIDYIKKKNIFELRNYSTRLSSELNKSILIVNNLQSILQNYTQINENERRNYYYNFLYNVLIVNKQIRNIFTIWKPFTLDKYDYKFKNLFQGYTGQYAVWINKERLSDTIPITSEETSLLSNYETKFQELNTDVLVLSPVQENQLNGEAQQFVRIIGAVRDKKMNLIAIVGIDIPISYFVSLLPIQQLNNLLLINENLKIIYAPKENYIGRDIKSYNSSIFNSNIYSRLLRNQYYFGHTKRSLSSSKFFIAYPIKYLDNFWILLKFIPKKEYTSIKWQYTKIMIIGWLATFLLFISLLIAFYILYKKIVKFLEQLFTHLYLSKEVTLDTIKTFKFTYKEYEEFIQRMLEIQEKNNQRINFIQALNQGNYDIPDLVPVSDADITAVVLNELKDNLKKTKQIQDEYIRQQEIENWRNTGLAKFNEILRSYINELEILAYETISNLTDYLDAQVGAFFVVDKKDGKEILELVGYYGYNRKIYEKKYFELGDGLTGNVALEKKPIVTRVPDDYVELASGLGKAKPNYIAVYPLISHEILYGVIEIAKIEPFEEHHLKFLDDLSQIIASSLATVRINQETKKLLEQSQAVTKQMQEKEAELEKTIKQMEKLQEESKEQQIKLESIFDALNEIVYYIEFTKNQRVITINKQIEDSFGITYTEATEKTFFELFNIPVTKIDEYKKYWENVLNGHKTEFNLEVHLEDKTLWIKATLIPIIKGLEIDRILFIGIDITPVMEKQTDLERLLIEVKEKEEKLNVQEMEMEITLQELEETRKALEEKENYIKKLEQDLQKLREQHQGLMKEFQKRLSHSRRLEAGLRERIAKLQKEVEELRRQLGKKE